MKLAMVLVGVAALLSVACKGGNAAKCEKGFAQMKEFSMSMMKALGGDKVKDMEGEIDKGKAPFMEKCNKLSGDALACIENTKDRMTDPKCAETFAQFKKK